ncbi:sulfotransferase [Ectothiorhodospiraceae bacterium 2226]|nr:sulfotransferase [Ectothiorhodospiraceae bacterium 2226]
MSAPFFVTGTPRSGTKLLRALIKQQPGLWIPDGETNFFPHFLTRARTYGDLAERRNFQRLAQDMARTKAYWYWESEGVAPTAEEWYAQCPGYRMPQVLEGLFRALYAREGAPAGPWQRLRWGDKSPAHVERLDVIARHFPASRFVHIVRDPRDVALSAERAWGKHKLRTAQRWFDAVSAARRVGRAIGSERYLELRYEDLVRDPEREVARVVAFLGAPFDPARVQLKRPSENLGWAQGQKGVVSDNAGRFQRDMAERTRRQIEGLCGPLLDELGYAREFPNIPHWRLGAAAMQALKLRDGVHWLAFQRRAWGGWWHGLRFVSAR